MPKSPRSRKKGAFPLTVAGHNAGWHVNLIIDIIVDICLLISDAPLSVGIKDNGVLF